MSNDHWNTPAEVLERVEALGPIRLDPCSNRTSAVEADVALFVEGSVEGRGFDRKRCLVRTGGGLTADWFEICAGLGAINPVVYVNPPYSKPGPWVRKCMHEAAKRGAAGSELDLVLLVPSDSGVRWFQDAWRGCDAVNLPDHRLAFLDGKGRPVKGNRGSSAIFYFGERSKRFLAAFHDFGVTVVRTRPPRIPVRAEAAE